MGLHLTTGVLRRVLFGLLGLLCASDASAQLRRIPAEVTPLVASDRVAAGTSARLALQVALPDGFHVQSNRPRDVSLIPTELTVEAPDGVQVTEVVFPKAVDFVQAGLPEPLLVFDQRFVIGVVVEVAPGVAAGTVTVPVRLRYQACDDKMCYAPSTVASTWSLPVVASGTQVRAQHADVFAAMAFGTGEAPGAAVAPAPRPTTPAGGADDVRAGLVALDRFSIAATTGGYLGTDDFLAFIQAAESGEPQRGLFDGQGPLAILLIVFLGGLALNLTPCVLPMIPINLAIIGAGAQAGSRRRGFLLGLTYGAAMAAVYGVLGVIVVLTASTFGTLNASPWFNLGIAVLFVGLSLAMFDVFEIDFSRFAGSVGDGASRGTFVLAFTMGAVAALLAGACVAPVVIQVVLFASNLYATGTTLALALPFVLGIGMAVPWPLAGAGLSALPKPGPWMVRVKQGFGVLILGTAVYYGYLAYGLFANQWVDSAEVSSSVEEKLKAGWYASLSEGLAVAEREQKPVLIDLWATWCKNCLTMDKTTLVDAGVMQALSGYVKIKVQAEQPDEAPTSDLMKRFSAVGLPAYVILQPKPPATAGR
jgi:thiol:disulfide interchange protein DsbD